jgi:excisionase family DNA binding protein
LRDKERHGGLVELYTLVEASQMLKVSKKTLERMLERGELTAIRLGERQPRITSEELAQFIASRPPAY